MKFMVAIINPHTITVPIVDALQIANAYSSDVNLMSHRFK